jgi:hypothetical protein
MPRHAQHQRHSATYAGKPRSRRRDGPSVVRYATLASFHSYNCALCADTTARLNAETQPHFRHNCGQARPDHGTRVKPASGQHRSRGDKTPDVIIIVDEAVSVAT